MADRRISANRRIRWADGTEATLGEYWMGEFDFMSDDFEMLPDEPEDSGDPCDPWTARFLELAAKIAQWSKDPSTKVGCVIVNDQRQIVGTGYNGFPRGVSDCPDRYADRSLKYLMVQHAEANAINSAVIPPRGCTAYVTHHPCANCAGLLIQAGIQRVCTWSPSGGIEERFADSFTAARIMFSEAGIELVQLNPIEPMPS